MPNPAASSACDLISLPTVEKFKAAESAQLRRTFEANGDGRAYLRGRSDLIDSIVARLYHVLFSPDLRGPSGFCLAAVGGYGRKELFPFSDVDLLFLGVNADVLGRMRESVATLARHLWDLRMRVGHSARTIAECGQLYRDNLPFTISLLDARLLAGDPELFNALRSQSLRHLLARDQQELVRNLLSVTRDRHAKYGGTIFHLEPNVKEAPGGLRDYHVARWMTMIQEVAERGRWVQPQDLWPRDLRAKIDPSFRFLATLRCFLHLERDRDDNLLSYELQEKVAATGLGIRYGSAVDPAAWMRSYFLHVRAVHRLITRLIEESNPARSPLYGLFQDWRSRLANADFSIIRGKIFPRSPAVRDTAALLRLFEMVARHNLALSGEAERWVEESLQPAGSGPGASPHVETLPLADLWPTFRRILKLPYTANALRAMHRLGLLTVLFPEFRVIDALVIRDFYHRYTVDEHSFTAIQKISELKRSQDHSDSGSKESWRAQFKGLYEEVEQPEFLALALLFHDVGKGMPVSEHISGSFAAAESVCRRLALDAAEAASVLFLIKEHLQMSAAFRKDIFDPEAIRPFAEKIGTPERLKMLCLFTYADISAVNPEAMTPWKAEMLWRLYMMTFNLFSHNLDEERFHPEGKEAGSLRSAEEFLAPEGQSDSLKDFLDGFPRRYLAAHTPEEVGEHFQAATRLEEQPVYVRVRRRENFHDLTVITRDRPRLFASVTGTLAGWGMNILKADAFSNRAGIVLDVFRFHDLFRTLELNPTEAPRLENQVADVLSGRIPLHAVMAGRTAASLAQRHKVSIPTQISFDDKSSSRCTLLELVTHDRPGLLYQVGSVLGDLGCNIEVALIDTEAQRAIDVFYLTVEGAKLHLDRQESVRAALVEKLSASRP